MSRIRVGIVSTSWWADAMYLPALVTHPQANIVAVCGRNRQRAEAFARDWQIPQVYTDADALICSAEIDALIVAPAMRATIRSPCRHCMPTYMCCARSP